MRDGRAAVDSGDGRDDGETESEALMGSPVVEPLERLKDALRVLRADECACALHGQATVGRDRGGADPDIPAGGVVAGGVVNEVRDQALE